MTTSKKVATPSSPIKSAATKSSPQKATPLKATSKKIVVKKPLAKAFAPAGATKKVVPVKPMKVVKAKAIKVEKTKKPKLVRESFTIPKIEYVVLEALKQRAAQLMRPVKKSELLRAAIKELAALPDAAFLIALDKVPALKTGRPASSK
jgi:hypothetical protein